MSTTIEKTPIENNVEESKQLDINENNNKEENNEDENSNLINSFSRNFNKCYHGVKFPKDHNSNYNASTENINENKNESNNNINHNSTGTATKVHNPFLYSLFEFDAIGNNNISSIKNNKNNKTKSEQKEKLNTNFSPKNHYTNKTNLNLSNSQENLVYSTNNFQMTTAQSTRIQNLKKKYLNTTKSSKSKLKPKYLNLKSKAFSQKKFDSFLERVKQNQANKEIHLNKIRSKSLEKENYQNYSQPTICKGSALLLKNSNRKPLYQEKPLNEETNLEKCFKEFYNKSLKENQTNSLLIKSSLNKNDLDEKYNNFYKDKIKWKNNIEQKNKNRKLNKEQEEDHCIEEFSFKPALNKRSLNIANRLNKNRSIDNFYYNNFYENGNDIETLDKFKTRLKPIMNNIYNYNNHMPYLNKRSLGLKRTMSEIYLNQRNNDLAKMKKVKKKMKINYKLNEKKFSKQKNNDINKNKNEGINNKNIIKNNINQNANNNKLSKKINMCENEEEKGNKKQELYKLNVREGCAWNVEMINKITGEEKYNNIIEGLL